MIAVYYCKCDHLKKEPNEGFVWFLRDTVQDNTREFCLSECPGIYATSLVSSTANVLHLKPVLTTLDHSKHFKWVLERNCGVKLTSFLGVSRLLRSLALICFKLSSLCAVTIRRWRNSFFRDWGKKKEREKGIWTEEFFFAARDLQMQQLQQSRPLEGHWLRTSFTRSQVTKEGE